MADWSYKDIDSFYDRVRAVFSVNQNSITDAMIDIPEKAAMAERIIKFRVPNWETFKTDNPDNFAIFESCIVYQTASMFESYVKAKYPKSMITSSLSIEYFDASSSMSKMASILDYIEYLIGMTETVTEKFYGFYVTSSE